MSFKEGFVEVYVNILPHASVNIDGMYIWSVQFVGFEIFMLRKFSVGCLNPICLSHALSFLATSYCLHY